MESVVHSLLMLMLVVWVVAVIMQKRREEILCELDIDPVKALTE